MKKKIISLILSAAMVATATVVPVSAADVKDFADVAADSWYYDSVDFVAERDYMNGTSATTFSPDDNMTRAMFVTVMARVAGAQTDNNAVTEFTDVPSGQWYTGAVQWGVEKGLVQGHGDGTFGTNDPITRQDTAVLAQRFLKWYSEATGLTPETGAKVDSFTDASSISDYAKDAVEYCRQIGLLTGYEDGSFKPLKSITRAEAATILKRMTFLAEGVLTVTYTDENGKTVMKEVKKGDTFTVDPNGGKITYDGKTYDAEFTITVGTASLTLPAPTRSGYTFKGWKVTEAADGTPAFTAQWASSGGGGGGSSVVTESLTYQVIIDAAKGTNELYPSLKSNIHTINFDGDNPISGDVTLKQLADEVIDNAYTDGQINKIINAVKGTSYVNTNGIVQDVAVKTLTAKDIIVVDEIVDYTEEFVTAVVNVLDTGVTSYNDFKAACEKNDTLKNDIDKAIEVVNEIAKKLNGIVEDGTIYNYIDDDTKKLLDAVGIDEDSLNTSVVEYVKVLEKICDPGAVTTSDLVGGVEIRLNLVDALKAQYGTNGAGAKDYIEKALKAAGVDENRAATILNHIAVTDLVNECNPGNFFSSNNDTYSLLTAQAYSEQFKKIIAAADTARQELCDAGLLKKDDIEKLIEKSVDKLQGYVDNPSLIEDLTSIKNKSAQLAELFVEDDPTLLGLLKVLSGNEKTEYTKDITFTLSPENIDKMINKIFEEIDVNKDEIEGSLIDDIKDKLRGTYEFSFNINVN